MCVEVVSVWLRPGTAESFGIETLPSATPTATPQDSPHCTPVRFSTAGELKALQWLHSGPPEQRSSWWGDQGHRTPNKDRYTVIRGFQNAQLPKRGNSPAPHELGLMSPPHGALGRPHGRRCLVSRRRPVPWTLRLRRARRGPKDCDSLTEDPQVHVGTPTWR